jgi:transcriptional regulator with XRE-family HTH domain
MTTRVRPGDQGAEDATTLSRTIGRDLRETRRRIGMSLDETGKRAGMSGSQLARIERAKLAAPTLDQLCRAARGVGLRPSLLLYPEGPPVRDRASLATLDRFEKLLVALPLDREVPLPIRDDLRAWDGRIRTREGNASIECESKLEDVQAVSRRVALKQRDDPGSGVIILLVNRTARNRRILAEHREALRQQFPLDGAAIIRDLRSGRIPRASGILLL